MSPSPRATRLVRVRGLQAFRGAVVDLATAGPPLDARDRLVVVPSHAAAALLVRSIEARISAAAAAVLLPEMVTPGELVPALATRIDARLPLTPAEREVLLGVACRSARAAGVAPPFRLRPGLIAEMLRFYDELQRRQNGVDEFERRALALLEPGAATDRGAERLVRQTRFLVAAYREYERRAGDAGEDVHALRARLVTEAAAHPFRHVVLAVGDAAFDPQGLCPAEWDLLTRVPGLERLDVVITETALAGAPHERIHRMLPGLEEVPADHGAPHLPQLVVPAPDALMHVARDREDEVADFARRVKRAARQGAISSPGRAALVVRQRLPYAYLAREVLRSAGVPCQLFDALPLASEPYAAALDLVLSCVATDFARVPACALLRSPHFRIAHARDVAALDRGLAEAGYLGSVEALARVVESWRQAAAGGSRAARAVRAGEALMRVARALAPLRASAPVDEHLRVLTAFLAAHEVVPGARDPLRPRHMRARGAILATLAALGDAYERLDPEPMAGDEVAALLRRWIDGQTFAPRTGQSGVHVVDADSARFGYFEYVHLAGLVEGEWPDRSRRSIFYSPAVLRELGWSSEADRTAGARAAFADLLALATVRVSVSSFALESEAPASPSPLVDEIDRAGLPRASEETPDGRIFDHEALSVDPVLLGGVDTAVRPWVARRLRMATRPDAPFQGFTAAPPDRPWSLTSLERYQDCPFKFFAADVLALDEDPEDESARSPRARGRFVHEVFERFFEAWSRDGHGAVTTSTLAAARSRLREVAEPLLARLPEADAALERAALFGSAISTGAADIVLGHEAASGEPVLERWLEFRLDGEFDLGVPGGRRVALRGVADRIDLLPGRRLRVLDYKSGRAPNPARALQAPLYALCARERLQARDGAAWAVDEAAYLAFSGRRAVVPVLRPGDPHAAVVLDEARARALAVLDGIAGGRFPPRPHDTALCDVCAFADVCRKDYVDD